MLAGMLGCRPALIARRMPNGMRPRHQLGEEESSNEKEVA
jgi:hypothetical protein